MRIIVFIVALGALACIAYWSITSITHGARADAGGASAPKQTLENARQAAKGIEEKTNEHLDDVDQKTKGD